MDGDDDEPHEDDLMDGDDDERHEDLHMGDLIANCFENHEP